MRGDIRKRCFHLMAFLFLITGGGLVCLRKTQGNGGTPPLTTSAIAPRLESEVTEKLAPRAKHRSLGPTRTWLDEGTVLDESRETLAAGAVREARVVQTNFKHPLVRVERTLPTADNSSVPPESLMVADHLLVKPLVGLTDAEFLAGVQRCGATEVTQLEGSDYRIVHFPGTTAAALPAMQAALLGNPQLCAHAEPDYLVHALATPNDPGFGDQWHLNNTGQTGGTVDADIDAPEAWNTQNNASTVVVAVVDSGIEYTHSDLSANIWTNAGEIANNGIDDDHDGYIDDTRGWNFVAGNKTPLDDDGHGTVVAGIIGARGNNGIGVSGVCWQVKLMPLKFLDIDGYGTTADAIAAVNYARVKGANIINHSWGGGEFSQALKDAIDAAGTAGILNVCAADNGGSISQDVRPDYPSSFASPSIIGVAASTHLDELADFSNYGPTTVHLAAPGVDITSTGPGDDYAVADGTSMAAPQISGIAALLKAYRSTLSAADLKTILQSSVDHIPALEGLLVTEGRANANTALALANDISTLPATGFKAQGQRGGPFTPTSATYTIKNHRTTAVNWTATLTGAAWATVAPASGTLAAGATATVTVSLNTAAANAALPGLQSGTLTIRNTTTSRNTVRPVSLDVGIYAYDLNTDPGWAREGQWQFGPPTNGGGYKLSTIPDRDPGSGLTGANVLGVNLNGNCTVAPAGNFYLTAGPFDLRGYTGTQLEFYRWLNTANTSLPHTLAISNDGGVTWTELFNSGPSNGINDLRWRLQNYPLGSNGDNQTEVFIRWGYAGGASVASWNLDDIKIKGTLGKRIYFDPIAPVSENAGTTNLTLKVDPPSTTAMTVTFTSNNPTAATLPASISVPANATSVAVTATIINDSFRDGTQVAFLTPSVAGYTSIPLPLKVSDDEATAMTLSLPSQVTEGSAPATGVLSVSPPPTSDVVVSLTSSDMTTASVPATVTLLAGQTSATFPVRVPDNSLRDGARTITITAAVIGWTGATASMVVNDDEAVPTLTLYLTPSAGGATFAEGLAPGLATLTLSAARPVETVATLTLSDYSRLYIPTTVVIPSGETSVTIPGIEILDDALSNGQQTLQITTRAPGFSTQVQTITVADNEIAGVTFVISPDEKVVSSAETVTVQMVDAIGATAAGFNGPGTLTAQNNGVADPAFPSLPLNFVNGAAVNVAVAWPTASANYRLRLVAGTINGNSASFPVLATSSSFRSIAMVANDVVYDAGTNLLYASTNAGTIVPVNPDTGALGSPISVSSGAVLRMEVSTTGSILYAAVENKTKLVRVDLATRTVGTPFSVGSGFTVESFALLAGTTDSLAASLNGQSVSQTTRVALFINGLIRPNTTTATNMGSGLQLTVGSTPNRVYVMHGYLNQVAVLNANADGVAIQNSYPFAPSTDGNKLFMAGGTSLALGTGKILDAESGNIQGNVVGGAYLCFDAQMNRFITMTSQPQAMAIYETTNYAQIGRLALPIQADSRTGPRLVRAGGHRVAYLSLSNLAIIDTGLLPASASPEPDLAVQQAVGQVDGVVTYSMLVRNLGNAAAPGTTLVDDLPSGCNFLSAATTRGTITNSWNRVEIALGSLAAGESATVSVTMRPSGTGVNLATITTTATESHRRNNSSLLALPDPQGASLSLVGSSVAGRKTASRVFATLGTEAGFFAGNLAVIDPLKAAVTNFIPIGSDPGPLALADDDTTLSVGLLGSAQIVTLNADTLVVGTSYSIGNDASGRRFIPSGLAAFPGRSDILGVARYDQINISAGTALMQGVTMLGTPSAANLGGDDVSFNTSGTQMTSRSGFTLALLNVSLTNGLSVVNSLATGNLKGIRFAGDRLITQGAALLNPATLAFSGYLGAPTHEYSQGLFVDPERQAIYALYGSTIVTYDLQSLTQENTLSVPNPSYVRSVDRWGEAGLAYAGQAGIYLANSPQAIPRPVIQIVLPATVAENAGVILNGGLVTSSARSAADRVISLQSTDPGSLQVPTTVTIPAGQLSATFNLTLIDDTVLNGGRQVSVIPSGPPTERYRSGTTVVADSEAAVITLTAPGTIAEGSGSGSIATVTLSSPAGATLRVMLTSSNNNALSVPVFLTIPAGQTTGSAPLTSTNDGYVRGNQSVNLTASVAGWTATSKTVTVTEASSRQISITYQSSSAPENAYFQYGTISLGGKAPQDMLITLTSSHPSRFSVPATFTIAKDQTSSANFYASPVESTLKDGRQMTITTASAPGLISGTANFLVIDNDVADFAWTVPATASAGAEMNVEASPHTIDGDEIFFSSGSLSVSPTASRAGTVAPSLLPSPWNNGISPYQKVTGKISVLTAGSNTTLSFGYLGNTYTSPPFTVSAGAFNSFVWDPPASQPQPNIPASFTVRAADGYGNFVSSFNGTANLTAWQSSAQVTITSGTQKYVSGINTSTNQGRLTIGLRPVEIGRAGLLHSVSLQIASSPGQAFDSFLIRARHDTEGPGVAWSPTTTYTTLRQGPLNLTGSLGWVEIPFTTPFNYDGTSWLWLDLSFNNLTATPGGAWVGSNISSGSGGAANSSQGLGAPENWNTFRSTSGRPNVRLGFGGSLPVTPAVTGNFVNGVWTGNLTFTTSVLYASLTATNGINSGTSSPFDVGNTIIPAAPVLTPLAAFTPTTTLTWAAVPNATEYLVAQSTSNDFTTNLIMGSWQTALSSAFNSLPEAVHYYFRVKARYGVSEGPWSNVVDTTQDSQPPVFSFFSQPPSAIEPIVTTVRSSVSIYGRVTDTSGITSLRASTTGAVFGGPSVPVNPNGTFTSNVALGSVGTTTLTLRATDGSTPARSSNTHVYITRKADIDNNGLPDDWQTAKGLTAGNSAANADPDGDGRVNLLEYAFNSNPTVSDPAGPKAASAINPDGLPHLTFEFDRRMDTLDLTYTPEFSTNLTQWSSTLYATEMVGSPTMNADGITEHVTLRLITPLPQLPQQVFMHLSVTNAAP